MSRELILCIDDDFNVLTSIRRVLETEHYKTIGTTDGAEALRIFGQRESELMGAFIDLKMQGLDGLEIMRQIRKTSDIPGIAISAYIDKIEIGECDKAGFTGYIKKPFSIDGLLKAASDFREYSQRKSNPQQQQNTQ